MPGHISWHDWSPEAFREAYEKRRPVLLSLVTAWSEGCAAMDHNTYARAEVVALVAERFVPVRVDADRRPDINDRYNLGGWPTTAFLTNTGEILSGGTYLDADAMVAALTQVADAYRDRTDELAARASAIRTASRRPEAGHADPIDHFRSLLIAQFDRAHGGFGSAPKLPHASALLFALSLAADGDAPLAEIATVTLDRMRALWDPSSGGFCRYAEASDWSRPGTEKTVEDNAALLHVYVEGALQLGEDDCRHQAGLIARWLRSHMSEPGSSSFFNAASLQTIDRTMYVDRNAMVAGALFRAAALFDDVWLRDSALAALEVVVARAYKPGDGVAHVGASGEEGAVSGLLTDQIHIATALIWAHAATGALPYSMLAAEVLQFAARTMWDEAAGLFRDRVDAHDPLLPFELNCHAACAFDRLAILTGDHAHQDRARTILRSLEGAFSAHGLFGAPYAVAVREVLQRRPPAGLELSAVDWKLG